MLEALRERLLWYRMPEAIMAAFFLGSAFFVMIITAIEHHLRK